MMTDRIKYDFRPNSRGNSQTMRCRRYRSITIPLLAGLCVFLAGGPARADVSLGFQSGLTGWNTPDSANPTLGDPGTVTASGGQATIAESTSAVETDLTIVFTVPTGAQNLQFTLASVFADSTVAGNMANGYLPDAFGASLLNPITLASLVPTVDQNTDSFYTRDVVDGVTQGQAATGVSVTPVSGTPTLISVDISSLQAGQQAEVLFRLIGGTDPSSSSTVTLSDVDVIAAAAAVPEPSTRDMCLLITGLVGGVMVLKRHRSVRATRTA